MAERTARRFMDAAGAFEDKSASVADLPPTILYQLAAPSTPEPIREQFMREAEATSGATAEQNVDLLKGGQRKADQRLLAHALVEEHPFLSDIRVLVVGVIPRFGPTDGRARVRRRTGRRRLPPPV